MTAGISLGELAVRFGCTLRGDPQARVLRVATLSDATADDLCFLANAKYRSQLRDTRAAAVVLDEASSKECPTAALITSQPYVVYAHMATLLHPLPSLPPGIHASAVVAESAHVDASAHVGAQVVIGAHSRIGARVVIGAGCVIGEQVQIGADTRLVAKVTLADHTHLGERCLVNPGAVLGSEGFGFAPHASGWVKVPQVGSVRLGNDVEIGANTTVDRGAIGDTVIEDGVKLDNLIQIAHNVRIGAHTAIAACTGVSGSTTIGKYCMIGGQAGIGGHISICDHVIIAGQSMVSMSIRTPGMYSSTLQFAEAAKFRRNAARFAQLDSIVKELKRMGLKLKRGAAADDYTANDRDAKNHNE